jgi:hypothetical protein
MPRANHAYLQARHNKSLQRSATSGLVIDIGRDNVVAFAPAELNRYAVAALKLGRQNAFSASRRRGLHRARRDREACLNQVLWSRALGCS